MDRARTQRVPLITMISPVTFWSVILIAVPLIYVLVLSFCKVDSQYNIVWSFTPANYVRLFDADFLGIYGNSLFIAAITTIFCILFAYPFAYIMAHTTPFRKTLMMVFLMLPFWTNSIIRLYGWRTLLGSNGYINALLKWAHFTSTSLTLYPTRGAVILGMIYVLFPFMALPVHTSIDKLDKSLLEASFDLGGNSVQTFFHVTLPLTAPGIFAGSIMVFIPALGYFYVSNIMGGARYDLISNVISRQFKESFNWPLGAAMSMLLIVITLLLVRAYTKTGGKVDELGVM